MTQTENPRDETAVAGKLLRHVDRSDDVPTSTAVIEAIAAVSGDAPTELPPLYDSIDPDALNSLFDTDRTRSDRTTTVSFTYFGYQIRVDSDVIEIRSESDGEYNVWSRDDNQLK